ncbi:MAG: hypothetical protein HY820_03815 [Acidobacteria bacterium]|nr:hypothetical protein [Acidobacteriota bacterium]
MSSFGAACFHADDRAAALNGGSYLSIPDDLRRVVNREFEAFIHSCIARRVSFAIEATLRSKITFDQARLAKAAGFEVETRYLALRDFAMHIGRVEIRADAGGHSELASILRRIYDASLGNIRQAVLEMDTRSTGVGDGGCGWRGDLRFPKPVAVAGHSVGIARIDLVLIWAARWTRSL